MSTVGTLNVDITADISGFKQSMNQAKQLLNTFSKQKAKPIQLTVNLNSLKSTLNQATSLVNRFENKKVKPLKLYVDISSFKTEINQAEKEVDKFANKTAKKIEVGIDNNYLKSSIDKGQKMIDKFVNQKTKPIKITLDMAGAQTQLSTLRNNLNQLTHQQTINVNANTTQAQARIQALQQQLNHLNGGSGGNGGNPNPNPNPSPSSNTGGSFNSSMTSMGMVLAPLSYASGGLIKNMAQTNKQFEELSTNIKMTDQMTDPAIVKNPKVIEELNNKMIDMSNRKGLDISDIQKSVEQGISSNVNRKDVIGFLEAISDGAIAGNSDNQTAMFDTTSTLNSYGASKNADNATKVMNDIVIAKNLGGTDMTALAGNIGQVADIAQQLGVSAEEMFSGYGMFTSHGLTTDEAGTQMSAIMNGILNPTKEALREAKKIGMDFTPQHLQKVGFGSFVEETRRKTGGRSDEIGKLYGDIRAYKGVSKFNSDGLSSYNEELNTMNNGHNYVADAVKTHDEDPGVKFDKSLNKLKNSLLGFRGIFANVFNTLANILNKVSGFINNLSPAQKKMATGFLLVVTALAPLLLMFGGLGILIQGSMTTFGMLGNVFKSLTGSAGLLTKAIGFLTSPVGLVIGAIVLLVGYLIYLYNTNMQVAQYINQIWTDYLAPLVPFFQSVWQTIMMIVNTVMVFIKDIIIAVLAILTGDWDTAWKYLVMAVANAGIGIVNILIQIAETVVNLIIALANTLGRLVLTLINGLIKLFVAFGNMATPVFIGFANGVVGVFNSLGKMLTGIAGAIGTGVLAIFQGLAKGVDGIVNGIVSGYNAIASKVGGKTINTKMNLSGAIGNARSQLWSNTKNSFSDSINWSKNVGQIKTPKDAKAFQFNTKGNLPSVDFSKYQKDFISMGESSSKKKSKPSTPKLPKMPSMPKGITSSNPASSNSVADQLGDGAKKAKQANDAQKKADDAKKKAQEQMQQDIDKLSQTLQQLTDSFTQAIGVFDKGTRKYMSSQVLVMRSENRLQSYQDWQKYQNVLMGRNELSSTNKAMIAKLTVNDLPQLRALATMTHEQLARWNYTQDAVEKISEQQVVNNIGKIEIHVDAKTKSSQEFAQDIYKELARKGIKIS